MLLQRIVLESGEAGMLFPLERRISKERKLAACVTSG
jgi:hypothetical protein